MSNILKLYWNEQDGTIADVGDIKPIADKIDESIDVLNPLDDEVANARGTFTDLKSRLDDSDNKLNAVIDEVTTARGGEATLNDRINSAEISAWTAANNANIYKEDAYKWAETDENVQVTDSLGRTGYSAYHWAKKAQEWATIIDGGSAYD